VRIAPAVAALAVTAVGLGSILASTEVRPGSVVGESSPTPASQRLSPSNGPVSLTVLTALRRTHEVAAATTVDTTRAQRPVHGGTVLR